MIFMSQSYDLGHTNPFLDPDSENLPQKEEACVKQCEEPKPPKKIPSMTKLGRRLFSSKTNLMKMDPQPAKLQDQNPSCVKPKENEPKKEATEKVKVAKSKKAPVDLKKHKTEKKTMYERSSSTSVLNQIRCETTKTVSSMRSKVNTLSKVGILFYQ